MAILKCKMCGGELEVREGTTVAECEYCGTRQTVPKAVGTETEALFNRANALRIRCEFDKAESVYEQIVRKDETQAEAYWGLILCKYGIEYVDDPQTKNKIPTCHRASYDSVVADEDYKKAIEYADMTQRTLYEEEALAIDKIQKGILATARREETYDVFICYKETDENGMRTRDSVIANDVYYQLTQEGYKVFYAAITLENKLGSEYEPIIFAALNSAKVMLVIGTKSEYFSAVWVKNEWSRFLKIMKNDHSKLLIPCYRDMDAYDLPSEFAHLQAQDMSKIGFVNDLVRGIKKVTMKDEPHSATVIKETVVEKSAGGNNVTALLERVFLFLEDENWQDADAYCEKVLDIDPKNVQAYLGKLLAEMNVRNKAALAGCREPFDQSVNYRKILRFGEEGLCNELAEYLEKAYQNRKLKQAYDEAGLAMVCATTPEAYREAAQQFRNLSGYADSDRKAQECLDQADKAQKQREEEERLRVAQQLKEKARMEALEQKKEERLKKAKECAGCTKLSRLIAVATIVLSIIAFFLALIPYAVLANGNVFANLFFGVFGGLFLLLFSIPALLALISMLLPYQAQVPRIVLTALAFVFGIPLTLFLVLCMMISSPDAPDPFFGLIFAAPMAVNIVIGAGKILSSIILKIKKTKTE